MQANQLRMSFSAMAYVLVDTLRRGGLRHGQFADAAVATLFGHPEVMAKWMRRTLVRTCAPSLSSLRRMASMATSPGHLLPLPKLSLPSKADSFLPFPACLARAVQAGARAGREWC